MTKKPEVRLTKFYQPHFQLGLTHNLSWVWLISRKLQSKQPPVAERVIILGYGLLGYGPIRIKKIPIRLLCCVWLFLHLNLAGIWHMGYEGVSVGSHSRFPGFANIPSPPQHPCSTRTRRSPRRTRFHRPRSARSGTSRRRRGRRSSRRTQLCRPSARAPRARPTTIPSTLYTRSQLQQQEQTVAHSCLVLRVSQSCAGMRGRLRAEPRLHRAQRALKW